MGPESGYWEGRLKIRGSPRAHLVVVAASIACIVAGAVIVAQLGWFLHDSSVHGTGLIHRARRAIAAAAADGAACLGPVGDAPQPAAPPRAACLRPHRWDWWPPSGKVPVIPC